MGDCFCQDGIDPKPREDDPVTVHSLFEPPSDPDHLAGAVPVADLAALSPERATAILMLRDWCGGGEGKRRVTAVFEETLGQGAPVAVEAFDALVRRLSTEGRRPMMRHGLGCRCVGSDEAVFANLLAIAATGDMEDAMIVASLLAPGAILPLLVQDAQRAGFAIRTICRNLRASVPARPILH